MTTIDVKVVDGEKVRQALRLFPQELFRALRNAGRESTDLIKETEGVQNYPPEGPGNQPPTPYYIRGRGMQYAKGNDGKSERYGTQFKTTYQERSTTIENRSSYAKHVGGEQQASHLAARGWRRLVDVANDKIGDITKIYIAWVNRTIQRLGL